ncbi:MAG TPA: ferritin family protein [Desulfuromonadales bacterium]|nr:ferritin family protein [Desulfuromonadales bacterium]
MNVFDFALKMEQDGKAYYEKLAKDCRLPGLKGIFTRLAADEQKHYETFQRLQTEGGQVAMADSGALEEAQNIFAELIRNKDKAEAGDDPEGYRHAMKLEADSFRLYEDAAAKEQDEGTKALLLRIAEEEHRHFTILENVYNFINAPSQYLAWREFSNLEEFRNFGRKVDQ